MIKDIEIRPGLNLPFDNDGKRGKNRTEANIPSLQYNKTACTMNLTKGVDLKNMCSKEL